MRQQNFLLTVMRYGNFANIKQQHYVIVKTFDKDKSRQKRHADHVKYKVSVFLARWCKNMANWSKKINSLRFCSFLVYSHIEVFSKIVHFSRHVLSFYIKLHDFEG